MAFCSSWACVKFCMKGDVRGRCAPGACKDRRPFGWRLGWLFGKVCALPGKGAAVIVVTNNPRLEGEEGTVFVEGTFRDVLVKVRDMVYCGYNLVSHPLFASSRMMFSPYRTVILGKKQSVPSAEECRVAEDSIISYDKATARRNLQPEHNTDYAEMDLRLHRSALEEVSLLTSSHAI